MLDYYIPTLIIISYVGGSAAWRVPLAFQFLFIIILFATVPWLPESPRWLMVSLSSPLLRTASQNLPVLRNTAYIYAC
jgi:hypothetical protein